ncbi:hypothetical protein [Mycolicibacter longobardus]|uniref:Prevent-host-death family protein n=1 Tax=Mycolicibacter longobardus TaxID=1108812 RepID=A0A1X1YSW2_9MYCO|nr:hypothetical protein [Mycolicibacter longobardus]MCV7382740.1 hypothetical protein [Mycolicibacter longobardus]ORW14154.1 hypothetical protein AWC16_02265 [Mycolicibacter longobardus]
MDVVSFSDLQLRGKATVESWLRESANRVLVVRRRDAEDLVLTTASRAAQAREASSVTSRLFVALMQQDPHVQDLIADVVPEVFPWVTFLSRDELDEFVVELVSTIKAAESIDNPAPIARVIDAWRHTAEVLADPELAAVLSAPSDEDFGPVPEPGARR